MFDFWKCVNEIFVHCCLYFVFAVVWKINFFFSGNVVNQGMELLTKYIKGLLCERFPCTPFLSTLAVTRGIRNSANSYAIFGLQSHRSHFFKEKSNFHRIIYFLEKSFLHSV